MSVVEHPYPINGVPLDVAPSSDSNTPVPTLFAVIELSGTQYKVTPVRTFPTNIWTL